MGQRSTVGSELEKRKGRYEDGAGIAGVRNYIQLTKPAFTIASPSPHMILLIFKAKQTINKR